MTFHSILCPVDFSDQSRPALRVAAVLAARATARLRVLTAVDPLLTQAAEVRLGLDLAKDTRSELRRFATAALPGHVSWLPQIDIEVCVGHAAEMILDAAGRTHADLVVMGTHGLSGVRKWLLGSTTDRVLRHTGIPVLVVPSAEPQLVVLEPGGPQLRAKRIVMATDFSDGAVRALEYAGGLARQLAVPLVLVHVVDPVPVSSHWQPYVAGIDEERVAQARVRLEQVTTTLPAEVSSSVVVSLGRPADAIARIAHEWEGSVVVMGLVGEQSPLAARPGSIAYGVLCLAHVPVFVVPPGSTQE